MSWPFQVVSLPITFLVYVAIYLPTGRRKAAALVPAALLLIGALTLHLWPASPTPMALTRLFDEGSKDNCYDGRRQEGGSITLNGTKEDRQFVACEYDPFEPAEEPSSASRTYSFDLPSRYQGNRIVALEGLFGIDEEDDNKDSGHVGAEAMWKVSQGDQELCTVRASWKSPGRCVIDASHTLLPDEPLEIAETVVRRGQNPEEHLYLGVSEPRLIVRP